MGKSWKIPLPLGIFRDFPQPRLIGGQISYVFGQPIHPDLHWAQR